jgi:hypothetical protein
MGRKVVNFVGQVVGSLTILKRVENGNRGEARWLLEKAAAYLREFGYKDARLSASEYIPGTKTTGSASGSSKGIY